MSAVFELGGPNFAQRDFQAWEEGRLKDCFVFNAPCKTILALGWIHFVEDIYFNSPMRKINDPILANTEFSVFLSLRCPVSFFIGWCQDFDHERRNAMEKVFSYLGELVFGNEKEIGLPASKGRHPKFGGRTNKHPKALIFREIVKIQGQMTMTNSVPKRNLGNLY